MQINLKRILNRIGPNPFRTPCRDCLAAVFFCGIENYTIPDFSQPAYYNGFKDILLKGDFTGVIKDIFRDHLDQSVTDHPQMIRDSVYKVSQIGYNKIIKRTLKKTLGKT